MKIKAATLRKVLTVDLALFLTLFFTSLLAPIFGSQAVTGPLVNAALFLGTVFLGIRGAIWIAVFPSIIAFAVGFLPFVMFPLIPFIITGNVILVLTFNRFRKNFWGGVIVSSFLKFLFLFSSTFVIVNYIAEGVIPSQAAMMMSWPQFVTALVGGLIAYAIISILKKTEIE